MCTIEYNASVSNDRAKFLGRPSRAHFSGCATMVDSERCYFFLSPWNAVATTLGGGSAEPAMCDAARGNSTESVEYCDRMRRKLGESPRGIHRFSDYNSEVMAAWEGKNWISCI